jgi:hypothetical protein
MDPDAENIGPRDIGPRDDRKERKYQTRVDATCTDALDTIACAAPDVAILVTPQTIAVSPFDFVEDVAAR